MLIIIALVSNTSVFAQNEEKLNGLGLVGELAYVKRSAENHAIRIFNHYALSDAEKNLMVTKYNDLLLKKIN